jgi:drug/metabolite transporter (DMT)-like permease
MLGSAAAATGMSLAVRGLAGAIDTTQTTLARCALGVVLILPLLARSPGAWRTARLGRHAVRGLLMLAALYAGYASLTRLPLATATALFFAAPLFVTALAPVLLGETVGWRRWAATAAGFAGVLVVLRPFGTAFSPVLLLPIVSSILFALVLLVGKTLSRTDRAGSLMLYGGVIMLIASLPAGLLAWRTPDTIEASLLLAVGVFGTLRTYFDVKAYATGSASFVSPFQYTRLIMIVAAAWALFGEVPDGATLVGGVIIVASTLYIAHREVRHGAGGGGRAAG